MNEYYRVANHWLEGANIGGYEFTPELCLFLKSTLHGKGIDLTGSKVWGKLQFEKSSGNLFVEKRNPIQKFDPEGWSPKIEFYINENDLHGKHGSKTIRQAIIMEFTVVPRDNDHGYFRNAFGIYEAKHKRKRYNVAEIV